MCLFDYGKLGEENINVVLSWGVCAYPGMSLFRFFYFRNTFKSGEILFLKRIPPAWLLNCGETPTKMTSPFSEITFPGLPGCFEDLREGQSSLSNSKIILLYSFYSGISIICRSTAGLNSQHTWRACTHRRALPGRR